MALFLLLCPPWCRWWFVLVVVFFLLVSATAASPNVAVDRGVYVAILSDRPMFVGMVSAVESVILNCKETSRLRL